MAKKDPDWRAIAAELFGEFYDEPERVGTYINQPPHRNGDPVMVHVGALTPKRYRKIAKLIERGDRT